MREIIRTTIAIAKSAVGKYGEIASTHKRKRTEEIVVIGLLHNVYNLSDVDIAAEINKPQPVIGVLLREWQSLVRIGNIVAYVALSECRKEAKHLAFPAPYKPKKVLGFVFTQEDERREAEAKRQAIRFFAKYGKGVEPHSYGEFFKRETVASKDKTVWLTLSAAARYCSLPQSVVFNLGSAGVVDMREVDLGRGAKRQEFNADSLDAYLQDCI